MRGASGSHWQSGSAPHLAAGRRAITMGHLQGGLFTTHDVRDFLICQRFTMLTMPWLLAKSWALGYAFLFLAILLGLLAVLIPSMRKAIRVKE
jgi:hypothetical protein